MNTTKTSKPSGSGPQVACPSCGELAPYSTASSFRPFCSERCKVIDLGAWASEQYKIAGSADNSAPDYDPDEMR